MDYLSSIRSLTARPAAKRRVRVKNALGKKLARDMTRSAMQFLSIIMLCSLGTFLFAALDGVARMAQTTIDVYFEQNNLADFWVSQPAADRSSLKSVQRLAGVEAACARASLDMETTLPGEPTLNVTAYDGGMEINVPIVRDGAALDATDIRGCLLQAGFADAHGLGVGDRIAVKYGGQEYAFVIRGIVFSPEYVCVTDGLAPNPERYGYLLINARAISALPLNQILVTLKEGADEGGVRAAIERELPGALVVDRGTHRSTANASSNASLFRNLTLVFPLLAYAVAALIVMTTLTRMIDNQRMQLGTLKALGFPAIQIQNHYLAYAVWPSLIGSVLGTVVGHYTMPPLIWALLIGQNEYPYRLDPPISIVAWGMVALSVLMSMFICLATYRRSARESAADLLRPKPPRDGKRILLERAAFLWKRFGFNTKMVVRNLMRNKTRTLMSCVGLLCCNALIIASLGLQDSVVALVNNHYTKTLGYDVRANLTQDAGEAEAYKGRLDAESVECVMERSVGVYAQSESRTTLLTVVEDGQQMLRLGQGASYAPIVKDSLAMTEKLAKTLGVNVGDTVELRLPGDDEPVLITVGQLVYNNISQGVYLTQSAWEGLRKGSFLPTAVQLKAPTATCLKQLADMEETDSLERPSDQIGEMMQMLDLLSSIFALLTLIALALAFVICYNMGLMNFAERTREYATLKVLGYHQREIRSLILRENSIITALGVGFGVLPGIWLTSLVLAVCETESTLYPSYTSPASVLIACAVTVSFSFLIQLLLTRKVRGIVMVEALKSVE